MYKIQLYCGILIVAFIFCGSPEYANAESTITIPFKGEFSCKGLGTDWQSQLSGKIEGTTNELRYDTTFKNRNGNFFNMVALKVLRDGHAILRWEWRPNDANWSVHLFEDTVYLGLNQVIAEFSAKSKYLNVQSDELCKGKITFKEAPLSKFPPEPLNNSDNGLALYANLLPSLSSNDICRSALSSYGISWGTGKISEQYVSEAKSRNLSPQDCYDLINPPKPQILDESQKLKSAMNEAQEAKLSSEKLKQQLIETQSKLDMVQESSKAELNRLKGQIVDQQLKGNKLVTTDQAILTAKSKLEVYINSVSSARDLETAMRTDYEMKIKTQMQQLKSRISLLTTAKVTAANSEEIKLLQAQLAVLTSRSFEDEEAFKQLKKKTEEIEKSIQAERSLLIGLINVAYDLDDERKGEISALDRKFGDLISVVEANRTAAAKDVAELKSYTLYEINKINADIGSLETKIAQIEKNQEVIESKQEGLQAQQDETKKMLNGVQLPAFEDAKDWIIQVPSIPVQQQQFCRVIDYYKSQLIEVEKTKNEIKRNALFKARQLDIGNLLKDGQISNWIVRVREVKQALNEEADISVSLPCRAMLGSNTCNVNPDLYEGTINKKNDPILYRELEKLSVGQFIVMSATMQFAKDPKTKLQTPDPEFAKLQEGVHCIENRAEGKFEKIIPLETFVIKPTNVVQVR